MPKLIILGTSNAISHPQHENTHMVLIGEKRTLLIDGPGNPLVRLRHAGVHQDQVTDILLTHYHPDHVSGIPLLLMGIGLGERTTPLRIYANEDCMRHLTDSLVAFEWQSWRLSTLNFIPLPDEPLYEVFDSDEFTVCTSPVQHYVPTLGLRIMIKATGKVLAYSADTAPTPAVIELARGADLLIHEATGAAVGHSSATQAGEIAREAGVKELLLIHYPCYDTNFDQIKQAASDAFGQPVQLAQDFQEVPL